MSAETVLRSIVEQETGSKVLTGRALLRDGRRVIYATPVNWQVEVRDCPIGQRATRTVEIESKMRMAGFECEVSTTVASFKAVFRAETSAATT